MTLLAALWNWMLHFWRLRRWLKSGVGSRQVFSAHQTRLFAQVLRIVAQTLIESMIAPQGERTERFGLHAHNAGRAVDLLVLANEIDSPGLMKEGA